MFNPKSIEAQVEELSQVVRDHVKDHDHKARPQLSPFIENRCINRVTENGQCIKLDLSGGMTLRIKGVSLEWTMDWYRGWD